MLHRGPGLWYRLGGLAIESDLGLADLAPFATGMQEDVIERRVSTRPPPGARKIFNGETWLGGRERLVECEGSDDQFRVRVPALDDLVVHFGHPTLIRRIGRASGDDAVIGPALLLAFAHQGVYALHASAARDGDGLMAFLGASGAGKSTLAEAYGADRVADDILPVGWELGGVVAYPHYPQQKLPASRQWGLRQASLLPVRRIFLLEPAPPDAPVSITRASATTAVLALIRNSVASRLFSGNLLDRHLSACADYALRVPVYQLKVPRDLTRLPEVKAAIQNEPA